MSLENEQVVRKAYQIAEDKDVGGWVAAFTEDGTFTDESIEVVYRGPDQLGKTVEIYATAFPDMHRELYQMYSTGDIVVVQLALQGTHLGRAELAQGDDPSDRQEDGRALLRRVRGVQRQDQTIRLLSLGFGRAHPARRDRGSRRRP